MGVEPMMMVLQTTALTTWLPGHILIFNQLLVLRSFSIGGLVLRSFSIGGLIFSI